MQSVLDLPISEGRKQGSKAYLHLHKYFMNFGHLHDELRPLELRLFYEHGKLLMVLLPGLCNAHLVSFIGKAQGFSAAAIQPYGTWQAKCNALPIKAHMGMPSSLFSCSSLITWGRIARYMVDMSISPTVTMALHHRQTQL